MHYRDGTPAKIGDIVACVNGGENPDKEPRKHIGVVTQLTPGGTSCNGQLTPFVQVIRAGEVCLVATAVGYGVCFTVGDATKLY